MSYIGDHGDIKLCETIATILTGTCRALSATTYKADRYEKFLMHLKSTRILSVNLKTVFL
jgi:hypothetical protein